MEKYVDHVMLALKMKFLQVRQFTTRAIILALNKNFHYFSGNCQVIQNWLFSTFKTSWNFQGGEEFPRNISVSISRKITICLQQKIVIHKS